MPIDLFGEKLIRSVPAEEQFTYPVSVVLSLHRERTPALLRALRTHHVLPALCHPWGSESAYRTLLRRAGTPLTVLDVPSPRGTGDLGQRVHALSHLSSVVVLVPDRTDSADLLLAGAANVIPRDTDPRELADRILAERRWLDTRSSPRRPPEAPRHGSPRPQRGTQQVLFDILRTTARPWCCHDLCLLLGAADEPMTRRALQARIVRLNERLAPDGISVDCASQWGRTTFRGLTAEPPRAEAPLRPA
ncbi:hypothetical protein ACFZAM_24230 [Streptomyces sp. NPDC008079]|uniref:hypothetical protein n=1 Tax=Streptomyces sp. NPDC008079 TaxID=3364806 RepID=UPI0036E0004E